MDEKITIEDFLKVDLRIGKIVLVEDVEDSRKLLKLNVNIGDEVRTVFAGIKKSYSPDSIYFFSLAFIAPFSSSLHRFHVSIIF